MKVYCPEHTDIFEVHAKDPILCQIGNHYLGGLPAARVSSEFSSEFWEFCCSCGVFRPTSIDLGVVNKCPFCGELATSRYWCNKCYTMSFDSATPARRQVFTISREGFPHPGCPGCLRSVSFSGIHEHECETILARYGSAFELCPCCKDSIGPPLAFPALVSSFLDKVSERNKLIVGFDLLEIEDSLLTVAPDGEFVLIRNSTTDAETILLPKRTHFSSGTDYAIYAGLYDCNRPAPGEVRILSPAVVEESAGGWRARERGSLEVVTMDRTPETSEALPLPPRAVDDLKDKNGARTRINENRRSGTIQELKDIIGIDGRRAAISNEEAEVVQAGDTQHYVRSGPLNDWRLRLVIGVIAGLILLSAVLVGIRRSPPLGNENLNASPTPTPTNMIQFPGGAFQMGNAAGDEYEKPAHKVVVSPFLMDPYEVTCEEYLRFVKAKNYRAPSNWIGGQYPTGAAKKPVTGVDWDDATAYASWAGKRLPTEEEWEFAARGADGRRYPWGDDWRRGAANADGASKGLADVGAYENGASLMKAYDMVGNAWEWTASALVPYPGGHLPAQPAGDLKVIRGGSWQSDRATATTTYRWGWPARGGKDYSNTGFRCVKDIPSEAKK